MLAKRYSFFVVTDAKKPHTWRDCTY
ncbi:hypothetical protein BBta_1401 [Bradyrhizobium sp. BTAi1]|nr:hypothetical protein BBta_1401 [Bradyrhizobium sp. BTAi1]